MRLVHILGKVMTLIISGVLFYGFIARLGLNRGIVE